MPYKCIPRVMVRAIVKQGNAFLNAFRSKDSVGNGLSPHNIIDNLPHVDYKDLEHEFGEYVQLHVTEQFTNTMKTRTIGAIVLDPRNITGRYDFMSLETGAIVDGRVVAKSPITDDVIQRVEQLGLEQNQSYRQLKMLQYEWRIGKPIGDDDIVQATDDPPAIVPEPIVPQDPGPNPFTPPVKATFQGAAEGKMEERALPQDENKSPKKGHHPKPKKNEEEEIIFYDDPDSPALYDVEEVDVEEMDDDDEVHADAYQQNEQLENSEQVDSDDESIYEQEEMKASTDEDRQRRGSHWDSGPGYGRGMRNKNKTTRRYGQGMAQVGRKKAKTTESHSFLQVKFKDLNKEQKRDFFEHALDEVQTTGKTNLTERYTTGLLFAQMTAKQGITKYGREAEIKLLAEFKQLMEYKVFHGRKASELTDKQKKDAANMINLIEEKINRGHTPENPVLRGRSVFNGKKQKGIYPKEELASPTVLVDAVFLTCIIAALQGREKAVTDINPNPNPNARMKDLVIMKITGPEIGLFCEIDPKLEEFVTQEKGKDVLYVQLDKALYGCVQSALLWYELYSETLMDIGFELNPYDPCVANANIDGKQCTVCWYVDDNIITHKSRKVIENVIVKIEEKFGKMSQVFGDNQDFLGMNIKFKKKKLTINMKKHIKSAFDVFLEEVTRNAATPAKSYLFEVREEAKKLDAAKAENFHKVVAALLFVSRVSEPDEDDWAKLRRVMQYLRGTIDVVLTLGADDITKMKAWVDVSYGVHADCRSHTGGCISFGWGVLLTICQKQKLNVKSSTEGEIVGVSNFMPNMIWGRMFLEAQGVDLTENILYQDNQSAMKIEKNGQKSSGKRTKHMDNRYFWIKDRLESEKIQVEYCPTAKMVADFFIGSLFRKLRDVVMGYTHISSLDQEPEELTAQERVGKDESVSQLSGAAKRMTYADVAKRNLKP